ncbi:transposase [Gaiella occulta]|uniref:Mutator family transposase n=1 Tax=Gaiella occulta TaxID=1002870 RepID=A0A7M2YSK6_9ACTN|nr:IS256 family transposase [Gaiella occulta]RDI73161.1 transposase [Gaiella occulta]
MRRTLLPSVVIEKEIDALLAGERVDVDGLEVVSEVGRLGVRLVLQRAVEEEVDEWLGRARYERRAEAAPGKRNGYRPWRVQTGEGAVVVEVSQVRDACAPFTSRLFRRRKRFLASEPLKALVIGAFVRGLSMRDVESLCEEAGLGQVSKSTASRLCRELKERFQAFRERDLSDIRLVCLFLDAIFLPVRPSGAKEGVLCAWGISEQGERVLLDVCLGMREAEEDWLCLGRALTRRGLPAPLLVVGDGAPGLVNAIEQLWPEADRQRCTVHRLRNVLAKLPEAERERVEAAYWRALDEATSQTDGERRLRALVGELTDAGYSAAAACLADDLGALTVHLRYPLKHRRVWRSTNLLERSLGEVKRRTKAIGRFPGETSCLSLCWAVLDLVIAGANRVRFDDLERQQIARIATEQNRDEEQEVVAA